MRLLRRQFLRCACALLAAGIDPRTAFLRRGIWAPNEDFQRLGQGKHTVIKVAAFDSLLLSTSLIRDTGEEECILPRQAVTDTMQLPEPESPSAGGWGCHGHGHGGDAGGRCFRWRC